MKVENYFYHFSVTLTLSSVSNQIQVAQFIARMKDLQNRYFFLSLRLPGFYALKSRQFI